MPSNYICQMLNFIKKLFEDNTIYLFLINYFDMHLFLNTLTVIKKQDGYI